MTQTPDETVPDETVPDETVPDETVPGVDPLQAPGDDADWDGSSGD